MTTLKTHRAEKTPGATTAGAPSPSIWTLEHQLPWVWVAFIVFAVLLINNFKLIAVATAALGFLLVLVFARDWVIFSLFALLAFSVEVTITSTTRITLPTEGLIPAAVFAVAVSILVSGRLRYIPSPVNWAVAAYFGLALCSVAWSEEPISTLKAIVRESGYVLAGLYLFQVYVTSRRRLIVFLVATMGIHVLLALYGFATQAVGGIRIYDDIANPFFIDHCIYAAFLVVTFSFLVSFYAVGTRGIWTTLTGLAALLIGAAIALTFVRAAWISVAVVLCYLIIRLRRRSSVVDLLVVVLLGVSMTLVVLSVTDLGKMIVQRLRTVTDTGYVANYDRLDRWFAAYHMWQDHPMLGVGYGAYPEVYEEYVVFTEAYSTEIRMGAHNLYLEILAELGTVGLALFMLILAAFRYEAGVAHARSRDPVIHASMLGAKAALLSILVHSFFNNLGPSDKISMTIWLLFSLVLVCKRLASWENRDERLEQPREDSPVVPARQQV